MPAWARMSPAKTPPSTGVSGSGSASWRARWRRRVPCASARLPPPCSTTWISSSGPTDQSSHMNTRRWSALAVMLCAVFLASVDFNIVTIAIPSIQRGLATNFSQVQLIVAGYALSFAVLLITGGRLGDLYGRRRMYTIGMTGFTIASALCGFAQSPTALVASRVLQGAFAAVMVPQALSFIQVTFTAREAESRLRHVRHDDRLRHDRRPGARRPPRECQCVPSRVAPGVSRQPHIRRGRNDARMVAGAGIACAGRSQTRSRWGCARVGGPGAAPLPAHPRSG